MEEKQEDVKRRLPILPMQEPRKPLLKDLNNFLICRLCFGYLVEATTIVECFHTYCRACIVQFLETNKTCPMCDTPVNKTKSYLSLRSDPILQRLVYKTVPGLFQNELDRRMRYIRDGNDGAKETDAIVMRLTQQDEHYFAPDEMISLALQYVEPQRSSTEDIVKINGKMNHSNSLVGNPVQLKISHTRYLRCPSAMKIEDMYKFIRMKYNLESNHKVVIMYDGVKLPNYFSLMDTAYTFSWNREEPLRLCYQIFECSLVQVPIALTNKIPDNILQANNSSYLNKASPSDSRSSTSNNSNSPTYSKPTECNLNGMSKLNLKRKSESMVTNSEPNPNTVQQGSEYKMSLREASVKIPRIENGKMEVDKEENMKREGDTHLESTSPLVGDNYADYEQDIEEVDGDEDDDDMDDRLQISHLSEEDTQDDNKLDDNSEPLVIDTSDAENSKEEKEEAKHDDKKAKSKRKSKKSKHHHHHKHRHRHKTNARQATILHSSTDTDNMKLTVKLNSVSSETKHHKQSKRRRRRSPENHHSSFSSSSSVSSIAPPSPDLNSINRHIDEDSLHSQISEFSIESADTGFSKEERSSTPKSETSSVSSTQSKQKENESPDLQKSPTKKENVLQTPIFRPKSITMAEKLADIGIEKKKNDNDDNNNNKNDDDVQTHLLETEKLQLLRPASSSALTVSKITAAEVKKEQQKQQLHNGNKEEPPALEITVVPAKVPPSTVAPMPVVCNGNAVTITANKPTAKLFKPIPAAIPLSQYQKMKCNEQTLSKLAEQHNFPKSLSITPHVVSTPQRMPAKVNAVTTDMGKKIAKESASYKVDSMKQSVTISLSENDSVLDLSGKSCTPDFAHKMLTNGLWTSNQSHYPMTSNTSAMTNRASTFQKPVDAYPSKVNRYPIGPSIKSYKPAMFHQGVKSQARTHQISVSKAHNVGMPPLTEIKTGPPSKPGPNQNVRSISNPSYVLMNRNQYQQQLFANVPPFLHPRVATNCSLGNLK